MGRVARPRVVITFVTNEAHALADDLRVLENGAGWLPLAGGSLVRVSGKGHREALQRVLSQDVLGLRHGEGGLALLLAPKGQFRAMMAVFAGVEESFLLAPPGCGAELSRALNTYLRLSRCNSEPVTSTGEIAVLGACFREAVDGAGAAALPKGGWVEVPGVLWFGRTLFGVPGAVAVAHDAEALAVLHAALGAAGARPLSEEAVELTRIRAGWPAWGAELTETVLPPEAGIEAETISYSKGCYVGQETVARMKTYGHPTRGLVGLRQLAGSVEKPSLPVPLSAVGEQKSRGTLTSWGWHPGCGGVGLALVRRELTEPGTRLAGDNREFEVTSFPLW